MADNIWIQIEETINAPVEKVWETMLSQESYQRWTTAFCEGARYEGSWSQGSRMQFLDASGDGMVAEIAENRPHEYLSIRHLGYIMKGVEDTESEEVRSWAPAYENYTFVAVPEGTRIVVDQEVTADFEEYMQGAWPKALAVLKQICEGQSAD